MSYVVLARKYRPQKFEDVVGQSPVCQILKNSIIQNRIGHAYIFSGQRGTGKTTIARIFAKTLNCTGNTSPEPCNKCPNCLQISEGSSIDILEIDGASNRGIDEIRALRDTVKFTPASSKYKVYIIDEAHQITDAAFNALLKTLEEPPSHTIFILATTESQKVPLTILSRCQRFRFSPIPTEMIADKLQDISKKEKFNIDKDAITLIARVANGSLRDSLSILDQIVSVSPQETVTNKTVTEFLGLSPVELIASFVDLIIKNDSKALIKQLQYLSGEGYDSLQFARELREYFHKLILVSLTEENEIPRDYTPEEKKLLLNQKKSFNIKNLLRDLHFINHAIDEMKWSDNPKLLFELNMLKIVQPVVDIDEIIKKIESIKNETGGKLEVSDENAGSTSIKFIGADKQPINDHISEDETKIEQTEKKNTNEVNQINDIAAPVQNNNITEDVNIKWNKVLDEIRVKKFSISTYLELAVIKNPSKDVITALLPEGMPYDFIKDDSSLINEIVRKHFGSTAKFTCEPTKRKLETVETGDNSISEEEKGEELTIEETGQETKELYESEPIINKNNLKDDELKNIVEGFSGKIIKW